MKLLGNFRYHAPVGVDLSILNFLPNKLPIYHFSRTLERLILHTHILFTGRNRNLSVLLEKFSCLLTLIQSVRLLGAALWLGTLALSLQYHCILGFHPSRTTLFKVSNVEHGLKGKEEEPFC